MSLSQASLSGVLDRLETRSLVMRRRDQQDRRKQWLLLTDAGGEALKAAPSLLPDHAMARFAELPEWEQHSILAGLLRAAELFEIPEEGEEEED
ncbi:MarR family protein [compost metagenome]